MASYRASSQRRVKTPAEEVADMDDLLTEILRRLPTKTLLQFKLVSKQWLSLISSPEFSISHTRFLLNEGLLKPSALFLDVIYKQPPTKFVFLPLNRDTKQLPLLDFMNAPDIKIMQSCTGLLLCTCDYGNQNYFICNPVIKKFKMISLPRPPMLEYQLVGVNLAFDPRKSPYYKIISIWQEVFLEKDEENNCLRHMTSNFSMDIYSSETDSWSVSKIKFTSEVAIQFDHAVFLNGAIHWDSTARESLYFDVGTECLMPMPMPKLRRRYSGPRYFGESGGYLHLAVGRKPAWRLIFRVYELIENYSRWFIMYRVDFEAEMQSFNLIPPYRNYNLFCLTVLCDENKGDSVVAVLESGMTLYYNLRDEEMEVMEVRTDGPKANNYLFDRASLNGLQFNVEVVSQTIFSWQDYQVVTGSSLVNYVLSPTIIDLGFLAVALAALSSQNPGVITIANAAFGSDPSINPDLLAKAF
ncbi:PREDICTED: F-box protein At5g07610 [Theobroma cacao]|uniref:F-box protein At5g07610 n=1 Tax=Theobroma cacao TaxID=3641 RepID=A0AB32WC84_THECC|nr:PREDICTED: F-box protein At5g07610 [Theobroma cacao]